MPEDKASSTPPKQPTPVPARRLSVQPSEQLAPAKPVASSVVAEHRAWRRIFRPKPSLSPEAGKASAQAQSTGKEAEESLEPIATPPATSRTQEATNPATTRESPALETTPATPSAPELSSKPLSPEEVSEEAEQVADTVTGTAPELEREEDLEEAEAILGDEAAALTAQGLEEENPPVPEDEVAPMWWGRYPLEIGEMGLWRIGPASIEIHRLEQEWRIITEMSENPLDSTLEVLHPLVSSQPSVSSKMHRYMFDRTSKHVELRPVLANRAVVVKPETPFQIRDKEEVTMFVTTPLWIEISVADSRKPLETLASFRSPDIWFGENTRSGELCYYSKLLGQLSLEGVQRRPYRIITPLIVRNKSRNSLLIERIRLPMEYLSIYAAEDNFLWTNTLILSQPNIGDTRIRLQRGAPKQMGKHVLLTRPANTIPRYLRSDAFTRFRNIRGGQSE